MELPDIFSLQCFVEAAQTLNFRAAAERVGITAAALGQRVRKLEDQLDVTLFDRTTRKVVLTQSGLSLLPRAREALIAANACVDAARGEASPLPRDITVGTRHELGLSWLLPMLPRLRAYFPGMTFHLYFGSGPDLETRVQTGEIDCAVSSRAVADPRVDTHPLHEEQYVLAASPALLTKQPLQRAEDAAHHTLIDAHASLPLFRYFRDAPRAPTLRFAKLVRMGTIAAIRELVIAGEGVAVMPAYLIRTDLDEGRLMAAMPMVTPSSDHFRLLFRAGDERRALFEALGARMVETPLK
jgi:LysR family transcriptional regulator, glycine cleavage system transcriptional activator